MTCRAFSQADVLASLVATGLLLGLATPLLSAGRGLAWGKGSEANLRAQHLAHMVYAADWSGRQVTFIDDEIASYGPNIYTAFAEYEREHERFHPGIVLGGGYPENRRYVLYEYRSSHTGNLPLFQPITFTSTLSYFGSFRLFNAAPLHKYTGGQFYGELFYAPEDEVVYDAVERCFARMDEYPPDCADISGTIGDIPGWSSYCLSAAAMFDPEVFSHDDPSVPSDGYHDPWSFDHGFRSPSFSQALYPDLKTHVLEHNWYDAPKSCNPSFDPGTYGDPGCEPFYFNHGLASRPLGLFYDGHIDALPMAQFLIDDERVREMTGSPDWGLWSKDTPFGEDGYLSEASYDSFQASPHVLTTDGILGRDRLGP